MALTITRYEHVANARCGQPGARPLPDAAATMVSSVSACEQRCTSAVGCTAARYFQQSGHCELYATCLYQLADQASGALLLQRQTAWPSEPARVQWRSHVAVVIASFASDLSWLQRLPADLADVVVYRKENFGVVNAYAEPLTHAHVLQRLARFELCRQPRNASGKLDASLNGLHTMTRPGSVHRAWPADACAEGCSCGCTCGARRAAQRAHLAFFARVPNFGEVTGSKRGGSREPSAYLQFVLDFWDNLPDFVIFTQDDCGKRFAFLCRWGQDLLVTRAALKQPDAWAPTPTPAAAPVGVIASPAWTPPNRRNCLCEYVRENVTFSSILAPLLGRSAAGGHRAHARYREEVGWPKHANFAVSRTAILAQPAPLYRALYRLVTVERQCHAIPATFDWSHDYERMWFALFDGQPKHAAFRPGAGDVPCSLVS